LFDGSRALNPDSEFYLMFDHECLRIIETLEFVGGRRYGWELPCRLWMGRWILLDGVQERPGVMGRGGG
jgi:hypothetical protein